jgi:hypothetical protein
MVMKFAGAFLLCGFLIGVSWLGISANQNKASTTVAPLVTAKDLDKNQPIVKTQPANPDEDLTEAEAGNLVDAQKGPAPLPPEIKEPEAPFGSTAVLSQRLFSKYVFAFEAVSLLLLVAIVGAVALAKSKGGTHHVAR